MNATDNAKILSALESLDPSMGEDDWWKVAAALRSEGEHLFDAFDQWSAGGKNYKGTQDSRAKWNAHPPQAGGKTISTLYGMAMERGWKNKPSKAQAVASARQDVAPYINLAALQANAAAKAPAPAPTEASKPSIEAQTIWQRATPATLEHPYCIAKGVTDPAMVAGLRVLPATDWLVLDEIKMAGALVIPLYRPADGALQSVQCIAPDGQKRTRGSMANAFYTLGPIEAGQPVHVVEGIGAAWAVGATGKTAAVTFGESRTETVARAIQQHHAPAWPVIVPDVDKTAKAIELGKKLTCAVVTLPADLGKKADAWDYLQAKGAQPLADLLATATQPSKVAPAIADNAHSPLEQRNADDGVVLRCGADLTPMSIEWLWLHWLGIGKLHILAGAPGQGKTTIALSIGATVTIGGRWPDGSRCEQGNILIWSGEDDAADTLLPRLLAAGADKSRCYFIEATRRDGEVVPFDPARDLPQLQTAIEKIGGIKLLIVDPVVSAVTGDSHKNTEVRRALQPLVDMGAACGCAVLGITHFAKGGQGTDPAQRVVGSVAFTAVARVVLVAAKVKGKDGEDARILARGKSNIGPDDGGFEYHLEQAEPIPGIQASRIAWGKSVEGSARELLTDPDDGAEQSDGVSVKNELPMLLWSELRDGPAPSKEVESALMGHGYSKKQIRNTREKMGVKPRKPNMAAAWFWELPPDFEPPTEWLDSVPFAEDAHEDAQDAQESKLGKLGNFGATSGKLGSRVTPKNRTPEQIRADGLEALRRAWETTGRQMDSEGGNFAFIPKAAIVQEFEREGLPEKATTNNLAQGQYISTRKEGWVMSQPKELARWGVAHPNAGDDDAIEVTF